MIIFTGLESMSRSTVLCNRVVYLRIIQESGQQMAYTFLCGIEESGWYKNVFATSNSAIWRQNYLRTWLSCFFIRSNAYLLSSSRGCFFMLIYKRFTSWKRRKSKGNTTYMRNTPKVRLILRTLPLHITYDVVQQDFSPSWLVFFLRRDKREMLLFILILYCQFN